MYRNKKCMMCQSVWKKQSKQKSHQRQIIYHIHCHRLYTMHDTYCKIWYNIDSFYDCVFINAKSLIQINQDVCPKWKNTNCITVNWINSRRILANFNRSLPEMSQISYFLIILPKCVLMQSRHSQVQSNWIDYNRIKIE